MNVVFFSLHGSVSLSIKFERETVLGKGAYGTVFRGEWNNKRVAVKRIELAKCEAKKEEEALKWLDHPNVVKLFHIDTYDSFR
jgi:serine/threonine protein kinase